jgi:hypothetical protein
MGDIRAEMRETDLAIYLPELAYVESPGDFPLKRAARVTARGAARWASRYWARSLGSPAAVREGTLEGKVEDRQRLIDDIYDWFEADTEGGEEFAYAMALWLTREGASVLDQREGFPGYLTLAKRQFRVLQRDWSGAGLPPDLYYPSSEHRIIIEPVELAGGIVLQRASYSPRKWQMAVRTGRKRSLIPSEVERDALFAAECDLFEDALTRRYYELQEPDRERDLEQLRLLGQLQVSLGRLKEYLSALELRQSES